MSLQKSASASSLILGLLFCSVAAFAQPAPSAEPGAGAREHHWKQGQFHGKGQGQGFMSQLGLSEEQKQKMKAMHQGFKQENGPAMEALKAKHQQLRQLRESGQGDSAEAKALRDQLKQQHQAFHAQREAQMKSVLSPEQFQKWQTMKQERMAKMREHRGQRQPGVK